LCDTPISCKIDLLIEFLLKVAGTDVQNNDTYLFNRYYFFTGIFSVALLKTFLCQSIINSRSHPQNLVIRVISHQSILVKERM